MSTFPYCMTTEELQTMPGMDAKSTRAKPAHDQKSPRLFARTAPALVSRLKRSLLDVQEAGYQFDGKKISQESLIAVALLHFLDLPTAVQRPALAQYLGMLEHISGVDKSPQPAMLKAPRRPEKIDVAADEAAVRKRRKGAS